MVIGHEIIHGFDNNGKRKIKKTKIPKIVWKMLIRSWLHERER